jgi:hypothetical protein
MDTGGAIAPPFTLEKLNRRRLTGASQRDVVNDKRLGEFVFAIFHALIIRITQGLRQAKN